MEEHDGLSYFEKVYPGCISWDDSKNSVEDYCIVFYDASGNEVCRSYWVKDPEMDSYHADDFLTHIEVSGTYRFSVQAIDEDDPSRNSEIAYSDWWPYYRPNQTLDVPVGLYADGTTLHWPAVARAGGYYVQKDTPKQRTMIYSGMVRRGGAAAMIQSMILLEANTIETS